MGLIYTEAYISRW